MHRRPCRPRRAFPCVPSPRSSSQRQQLDRPRGRRLTAAQPRALRRGRPAGSSSTRSTSSSARTTCTLWSRFGLFDRARARSADLSPARAVRVLGARRVPRLDAHFPAWRRAMLDYSHRHTRLGGVAAEATDACCATSRPRSASAVRSATPTSPTRAPRAARGLVELEAGDARARLPLDERAHHGALARGISRSASTSPSACCPESRRSTPLDAAAFRRWHLRALAARDGRRDRDRPAPVPHLPALRRRRARARRCAAMLARRRGRRDRASRATARRWFALAARSARARARRGAARAGSRGTTLLAPFDSFLWHRERTRGSSASTIASRSTCRPPSARFGYYTLPILVDGQLIGRVDAKTHRAERRLELRHVAFEPALADVEGALAGTAEAARSLAAFVGAGGVGSSA